MDMTLRTLDVGADKQLLYLNTINGETIWQGRGLSLCLNNPTIRDIFIRNIAGILLASGGSKNIKMMFPMVNSAAELVEAKKLLHGEMEILQKEKSPFNKEIKIGAMIESSDAVKNVDEIAGSGLVNFPQHRIERPDTRRHRL